MKKIYRQMLILGRPYVVTSKKIVLYVVALFVGCICTNTFGQKNGGKPAYPNFYTGIGLGLDYGGIGVKLEYLPVKNVSVFAGVGANLIKIGVNGGLCWKIFPQKNVTPYLMGLYGYNSTIKIKSVFDNTVGFQKTYYGPSIGAGFDFKTRKRNDKWSLGVIVPFRSSEFKDTYDEFKQAGYVFKLDKNPLLLISLGYNFNNSNYGVK